MSTVMWFIGFGLMMASFSFLFGRTEERHRPRITIEPRLPDAPRDQVPAVPPQPAKPCVSAHATSPPRPPAPRAS